MRSKQKIYIKPVGTGVLDGPMSHRSQIVYPFAIKIKATYGNEIFIFCFRTAEDVGPYKFWHMPFVSSMDGCAAITDIFGRGDPSPTAFSYFSIVGEAFRLPLFDLHHCSVNRQTRNLCKFFIFYFAFCIFCTTFDSLFCAIFRYFKKLSKKRPNPFAKSKKYVIISYN